MTDHTAEIERLAGLYAGLHMAVIRVFQVLAQTRVIDRERVHDELEMTIEMVNDQFDPKRRDAMIKSLRAIADALEHPLDKAPQKSAEIYQLFPNVDDSDEPHS
jgi:hypothetical protein